MAQQEMFEGAKTLFPVAEQNKLESIVEFIYERHKVFLKKNVLKKEAPWTKDPYLQNWRFCNIYREIDTVSLWIYDNIIVPYEKHPHLWFMLCIARLINWPDTLQELMDKGCWPTEKKWDADKMYKVLAARAERKEKVITGAYIVNTQTPKGMKVPDNRKVYYIPKIGLDPMWQDREKLAPIFKTTLKDSVEAICQYHGWALFMSYQVVVDLSYSKRWLGKASDYNTFTSPGPGTIRGMNRLMFGGKKGKVKGEKLNGPMQQALGKVNVLLRKRVAKGGERWWTDDFRTGFQELSMSNFSNANCEYDKYCRLIGGEGEPRSRYKGA